MPPALAIIPIFTLLFLLWGVFRFGIFVAERMGGAMVPPDVYPICTWMLRIVLIFTAGVVFLIAVPGMISAVGMGDAFGGTHSYGITAAILSIGIYAFATMILNAPYFPLRWSIRAYGPVHLVLLPIVMNFREFAGAFLIPLALYSFLWRLCLADRQKIPAPM
ncbi:hypothetical protein TSACC_22801 [Terrimicrobium sacchariphilum]|uniref:Uncharacterized protein n=1 Tax=Terrimicrobium sacchariphilum TaxID=690879 RepID=A0A146GCY7_TERSA|nr:hypothetical protein [Terrimicrobium sacchariphilum]GAT34376.1 hypothetical protein TSACC_22801 [Terrimicrobium sacchariphilum]